MTRPRRLRSTHHDDRRSARSRRRELFPRALRLALIMVDDGGRAVRIARRAVRDVTGDDGPASPTPHTAVLAALRRMATAPDEEPTTHVARSADERMARVVSEMCDAQGLAHRAVARELRMSVEEVARLHAAALASAGVEPVAAPRCCGWSLVRRYDALSERELVAARSHLSLCRSCSDAHAARRTARSRLRRSAPLDRAVRATRGATSGAAVLLCAGAVAGAVVLGGLGSGAGAPSGDAAPPPSAAVAVTSVPPAADLSAPVVSSVPPASATVAPAERVAPANAPLGTDAPSGTAPPPADPAAAPPPPAPARVTAAPDVVVAGPAGTTGPVDPAPAEAVPAVTSAPSPTETSTTTAPATTLPPAEPVVMSAEPEVAVPEEVPSRIAAADVPASPPYPSPPDAPAVTPPSDPEITFPAGDRVLAAEPAFAEVPSRP